MNVNTEQNLFKFFQKIRSVLALYWAVLFLDCIVSAPSLFSNRILAVPPLIKAVWNPLYWMTEKVSVQIFLTIFFSASVSLFFSYFPRVCAFIVGTGGVLLFQQNFLIYTPSLPVITWLLFAISLCPADARTDHSPWKVPPLIMSGAWFIFSVGYFLSGFDKLRASVHWQNGEALKYILQGTFTRADYLGSWWAHAPQGLQIATTWIIPATEIFMLSTLVFKRFRRFSLILISFLQLGNLLVLNLVPVAVPMLIFHGFLLCQLNAGSEDHEYEKSVLPNSPSEPV